MKIKKVKRVKGIRSSECWGKLQFGCLNYVQVMHLKNKN